MTVKKGFVIKLVILSIAASSSFFMLGCNTAEDQNQKNDEGARIDETTSDDFKDIQEEASDVNLAIDHHRCIGCGKCARISPQNFKMKSGKAIVISQEKKLNLQQAIDICPVNAITS